MKSSELNSNGLSLLHLIWTTFTLNSVTSSSSISHTSAGNVTNIKVGVMINGDLTLPYSVQRTGPAVDIALEYVNTELLNESYQLVPILRIYDDICDARRASGKVNVKLQGHTSRSNWQCTITKPSFCLEDNFYLGIFDILLVLTPGQLVLALFSKCRTHREKAAKSDLPII